MNLKTGKVFDMTKSAMDSLKKYNLFQNYMIVNPNPTNATKVETKPIEQTQPTESFQFTNYVESSDGTTIEMDNEKPKRKYNKKSQ